MMRIHYTKPSITDREVDYAKDAAQNGWGPRCYDYIERFEQGFAEHLGVRHAIATSSCTGALHMGLAASGIGPGDEVILGDINWIASASPITYLGAKPVFVDVLEDSWCLDPNKVEAAITPRTKAIIAVHLYGNLADLDALSSIAERHGVVLIEDAAEAIGSQWRGRRAGSVGHFGTFSFHGTKTMTTGEGGMFVTNDQDLYGKVLTLNNHGRSREQKKQFWADEIGFKYRMPNIAAAIGCAQLERIEDLVSRKREIFRLYEERLRLAPVKMNPERVDTVNGYWMPTIVVDKAVNFDRASLLRDFAVNEIDGRVFFWPLSSLPMFEGRPDNAVSYDVSPRAVNLPSYHDLTPDEIGRVCDVVLAHV